MKKNIILLLFILMITYSVIGFAETIDGTEQNSDDGITQEELIDVKPVFSDSKIKAESVMLIDARTGLVMYELEPEKLVYPASTTKIMTCLIVLEETEMSETVTCGSEVEFGPEYSVMGVVPGEIVTVRDLIYGMMLESGNDAANALAVHIGGSESAFAKMMNQKALELGMADTSYKNAYGGHDDNHFTTAKDMAKLAMVAYNNSDFMEVVGTAVYQPEATNMATQKKLLGNSNRLIRGDITSYSRWYNEYATGIKTGYTGQAGNCLIASSSIDNQDLIVLIFGHESEDTRFTLANDLFEFGYNNYTQIDMSDLLMDSVIREPISNATADDINGGYMEFTPNILEGTYFTETNAFIKALKSNTDDISPMVDLDADLRAPIINGEIYGKVIYKYRDRILTGCELLAAYDMLEYSTDFLTFEEDVVTEIIPPKDINTENAPEWWWAVFPSLLIVFILYKSATYNRKKFRKKRNHNDYN